MKSILQPSESISFKEKVYLPAQEEVRKDIERAFGVLTIGFNILSLPCRLHHRVNIAYVMQTCIFMHNTIVEARRDTYENGMGGLQQFGDAERMFRRRSESIWQSQEVTRDIMPSAFNDLVWTATLSSKGERITRTVNCFSLKLDLIEHMWERRP